MVEKAKQGVYTQFEAQRGMPIQLLLKYFAQLPDNNWQVKDTLRAQANFRLFNLLDDFAPLGRFDIIFCRNVLIYFDDATKTKVLDRMSQILNPGGYLLLGASETILGLSTKFKAFETERGLFVAA